MLFTYTVGAFSHEGDGSFEHRGLDKAGGQAIDGDVARGDFLGQGFGKADNAGLGGGVIGLSAVARNPNDGGDINDSAPAPLHHAAQGRLGQAEGGSQVHGYDLLPIFVLQAQGQVVAGQPGVINDDIDRT